MTWAKLTLGTRLLLLQLVVFGGLALASPVTYVVISNALHRDRDQYLLAMAGSLVEEYLAGEGVGVATADLPARCLPAPVPPAATEPGATHRPRHLLIVDGRGALVCSDGELQPLAPAEVREALTSFAPSFADVRWSSEVLRVVAWPFRDRRGDPLVMEVGTSFLVIEGVLRKGHAAMIGIEVVALAVLLAGSLLLTRRALAPIDRIIRRVEQIDEARLDERLPAEAREDQVGRLVTVINRMLDRLARAFEAQSRFSSDVAHEIRSPLTALRGQIEVALRRERTPADYRQVLKESLEEVLRLARLAEDLMSLAQADAGVLCVRRGEVELRELLFGVAESFASRARAKNIRLRVDAPHPRSTLSDRDLMARLVANLLDNALIHTPHMGEVWLRLGPRGGGSVIVVEDSGPGIPAAHLARIFDRFYRVDPARSREMGGAGLGLAIVHQIALAHGGSVEVRSEEGRGAVFEVVLPGRSDV